MTREEPRCKHANDVPLQYQGSVVKREPAHLHGQWGGCHQQVHHAIAQRGCASRHDEHRLLHDDGQWPTFVHFAIGTQGFGCGRWEVDQRHHGHGDQCHHGQRQVGPHERHVCQRAGAAGQVGAQHSAHQTACQYQRHGFFLEGGQCQFGRCKPVQLAVGAVVACDHRGRDQQPEIVAGHCPCPQQG